MSPYNEKRIELKYKISPYLTNIFLDQLKQITWIKNEFPNRIIHTIYFDDINLNSCNDNIQGMSKRKKVRIRFFDDINDSSLRKKKIKIYLEIKKKDNKYTLKKKSEYIVTSKFLENVLYKNLINIFINENNQHFFINLYPTLYVSYERSYFRILNGNRMTVDKNIKFSDINFNKNIFFSKKLNYFQNIIELKIYNDTKIPAFFKSWPLTLSRHSKYVAGLSMLGKAIYL